MTLATRTSPTGRPTGSAALGWVHLCNGLDPRRDGGMVPSILGFAGALARLAGRLVIATPTPSDRPALRLPRGVELEGPVDDIESWVRDAEVVHFHGLWQTHTRRGAAEARRSCVPHLIAAHGMAEPWALAHKRIKKRIYTALIEGKNLRGADCLHALSRPEVDHLRALAPRTPVCLVPNGVDLAPFDDLPARTELEAEIPAIRDKFVLLFYGRLHVKKGLDLLADALGRISRDRRDVHLLLAGNDDGALGPFENAARAAGLQNRYTVLGHVAGERARKVWAAADAFVLPSYSEGFSMAILEALAAVKPVVITTACHFPELAKAGGGIVVEPTREGVHSGLRELLECSDAERAVLARNGRRLVENRYTWDRQAERLAQVYDWIRRGGSTPEAVVPPGERA
ncbi:MAG: glycosyltransferase [Isosphaeraceae bacterium]|nr:glycosyltransferase [Isosphaeraceae bacterium]